MVLQDGTRYVYYLVTRRMYWDPHSEAKLRRSAAQMALHCADRGVRHLAVNRLSGGGVTPAALLQILRDAFQEMDIKIYVYK